MKLCVVTGEASGDLHAAHLVRELRKLEPALRMFGTGGAALRAEGMDVIADVEDLAIVGLFNVLRHLPRFFRLRDQIVERVQQERPDAVLLVDFPDFNLRVARRLRAAGIPVVYFISPQVWAWRQHRVREIAESVDHMIVIFPFEEEFYVSHGVPVTYVGHPLVDQMQQFIERLQTRMQVNAPVRVALLPGSRRGEVRDLLPPMIKAVRSLAADLPIEAFVVKAPTVSHEQLRMAGLPAEGVRISDRGREALLDADVALASSGTATLECAMLEVPPVVMYRLSGLTYRLARRLVRIPHFSLVNIVAQKRLVPELLQDEVTPERIVAEVHRLIDPGSREQIIAGLRDVREKLGQGGAAERAARVVHQVARGSNTTE